MMIWLCLMLYTLKEIPSADAHGKELNCLYNQTDNLSLPLHLCTDLKNAKINPSSEGKAAETPQ